MHKRIWINLAGVLLFGCLSTGLLLADGHRRGGRYLEHDGRYTAVFYGEREGKGNETAGEATAWLLAAANLSVVLSLLIKGVHRFQSVGAPIKKKLQKFNRYQKKLLMPVHYWLNPVILFIALWHWVTSCCRSTALPEWGLLIMTLLMVLGVLIKFKLGPKVLRKGIYQAHTKPYAVAAMVIFLIVGHLMVD